MKTRKAINSKTSNASLSGQRRYLTIFLLLLALGICSTAGIYAFLANQVTKVDVSAPDAGGPVIVPENYQNLLVLDVSIPRFDGGPVVEDIKLHNGVAASDPRDVLTAFESTDWYSDHDGDAQFDGNQVSGSTEAIVSSSDNILDSGDNVRKTGLCLIKSFIYIAGLGEQYIDHNRSLSYTSGEAVVRTGTASGEIHPGEVVRNGTADMTPFLSVMRFTDGVDGSETPAQYHDGESILLDVAPVGVLSDADTILTPGDADLNPFPGSVLYSDFNGNGKYGIEEPIIADGGEPGQLDAGLLDGTGIDTVIRAGNANLRSLQAEGLLFADHDGDDNYTPGECIVRDAGMLGIVEPGDIVRPGLAILQPFSGSNYLFTDDNVVFTADGLYTGDTDLTDGYQGEAILKDANADGRIDNGELVTAGYASLRAFPTPATVWFVDSGNPGNGLCDPSEAVIMSGDDLLSGSDTIVKSGFAFLKAFDVNMKWADADHNSQYDDGELIASSSDNILSPGEVVKPGYCDLKVLSGLYEGQVYSDNDGSGGYSSGELVIFSEDKILDAGDTVSQPGTAALISLEDSITRFIDTDGQKDFDPDEPIVYDRNGGIPILDDGDGIARSGPVDMESFADEIVCIDQNGDGNFQGDSDNDVNWDDSDDETWANDPDVINDQDEVVLNDPTGPSHLALDPGDTVLRPGIALLTLFPESQVYIDDGNGEYDGYNGVDLNEAVIQNNSSNLLLDSADVVLATGRALIRDFDPPISERYIDANNDGIYTTGEAVIIDSSPTGTPNGLLDAGALDGTDVDQVTSLGAANLSGFNRAEKFVDGDRNGAYDLGEAIVYDWYKSTTLEGEYILAGDPRTMDQVPTSGSLAYQPPGGRTRDCVLLASDVNSASMMQLNNSAVNWYIDNNHSDTYDGFYSIDGYEVIIKSANGQLEEGDFDGTGTDHVIAAGYASMRMWSQNYAYDPADRENLSWTDNNHDGEYQSDEAIVYDAAGDAIINSIGTESGNDQIVVAGQADLNDLEYKYVDANGNDVYDEGELKVNDANKDDKVQNDEIAEAGPVPFFLPFVSSDYRYADPNYSDSFDQNEAIVYTPTEPDILNPEDEVITAGDAGMVAFADDTMNMFVDYDHDTVYDANETIIHGNGNQILEASDQITVPGVATSFNGMTCKYSDADRNNEYTDGELIVNDLNSDDKVDTGEIISAGLSDLEQFSADAMYIDNDDDDLYSSLEAVVRTSDDNLDSGDEVLATGLADLTAFGTNVYRFTDADHDDKYDENEAIVVEANWGTVDDMLENSDIVLLEGAADIEQFPANFLFLDDAGNSGAYEDGEAIVNDSNGNGLLDPGEIVTGGRAVLRKFAGGEKYTDGGEGANARNSQYDPDEAIIRDGNSNDNLDLGPLDGGGNDTVLVPGKAALTQFSIDERYVDKDGNGVYDGGQASEDIYLDQDSNGIVTLGDDALQYFVVENSASASSSDLAAVRLWADRDRDGNFEPETHDAPAVALLVPDAPDGKMWYEGPATAPPLASSSTRDPIDYTIVTARQRFFVTVDISSSPTDGSEIQMQLPLNGVKTFFGLPGPSDMAITNAYIQKIDFAAPDNAAITSPPPGAVVNGQVTIQAEASDSVQVGKVEFYDGPPGGGGTLIAIDDDGPPWEILWDGEYGYHTLYARAYDRTYLRPPPNWEISHYADSQGVPITVAISANVELSEGWNLISVPVEAFDTGINSVLSPLADNFIEVWTYLAPTLRWLRYDTEGPGFLNDLNVIQMGNGYWILMSTPDMLTINGTMPDTAIPLQAGWNLVGFNSLSPMSITDAMSSIDCEFSIWAYDPGTEEWLKYNSEEPPGDLDELRPGRGYLIYVPENCLWHVNPQ